MADPNTGLTLGELVAVGTTVAAVMVPLGGVIIGLVRRNIGQESKRNAEIHDAFAKDLNDKETRLRELEESSHVVKMVEDHEVRLRSAEGKLYDTASRKDVEDARNAIRDFITVMQENYEKRLGSLQTIITDAIVNRESVEKPRPKRAGR